MLVVSFAELLAHKGQRAPVWCTNCVHENEANFSSALLQHIEKNTSCCPFPLLLNTAEGERDTLCHKPLACLPILGCSSCCSWSAHMQVVMQTQMMMPARQDNHPVPFMSYVLHAHDKPLVMPCRAPAAEFRVKKPRHHCNFV